MTYSTPNKTTYNGVEFTGNVRRNKFLLFGGVTTDRRSTTAATVDTTLRRARQPERPAVLRRGAAVPDDGQGVGGVLVPVRHQPERIVLVDPGAERQRELHGHLGDRRAARSSGRPPAPLRIVVNLIQPGTVFLDTRTGSTCALGKTFRFGQTRIQGFADIFNVFNAGTVLTVNQTYAAAGTNAWMTPNTIMDGRYVRFGMQLNF